MSTGRGREREVCPCWLPIPVEAYAIVSLSKTVCLVGNFEAGYLEFRLISDTDKSKYELMRSESFSSNPSMQQVVERRQEHL